MTITIDERLAQLAEEFAALKLRRTRAEQEIDECVARMDLLNQRSTAIQVASTALAGLPPVTPEQEWLDNLMTKWRPVLCDELLSIKSPIRDAYTLGVQTNLSLSIRVVDFGLGVLKDTGYDLTTLRLGQLMREAGFEPAGADPDRHYVGVMPWFGSLPEVERRIMNLQKERDEAQARLDEALLDDTERERRAAEAKAQRETRNAAPQRKVRGDGSQYDRYPDGRVVEVMSTPVTPDGRVTNDVMEVSVRGREAQL